MNACLIGRLMHFDSSGLKDYYFIDSQWLCDMFAHVVSSEFNSKYIATVFLYLAAKNY